MDIKSQVQSKDKMIPQSGIINAIAKANRIPHHRTIIDSNAPASESLFDADMKNNTKVFWHQIMSNAWNNEGKVIRKKHF